MGAGTAVRRGLRPQVSVIVPTLREAENLPGLLDGIDGALSAAGIAWEVVIVDDDSDDGTAEVAERLAERLPVLLHVRHGEQGLATAVIAGLQLSEGELIVVMDADGSHDPAHIPELLAPLRENRADFVLGSRHVEGGEIHHQWPLHRRLLSAAAALLVRPLVSLSDPMSGFFALRRVDLPPLDLLSPVGYKIGLEVLLKGRFPRVCEVPILFVDRAAGESKLTLAEQVRFLRHLRRLYQHRFTVVAELVQFAVVGATGFCLDLAIYLGLQLFLGVPHTVARAISFWPVVSWNWIANRSLTFSDRRRKRVLLQWPQFVLSSSVGFTLNYGAYFVLTTFVPFFAAWPLLALMSGVLVGMGSNFLMASLFVFRPLRDEIQDDRYEQGRVLGTLEMRKIDRARAMGALADADEMDEARD